MALSGATRSGDAADKLTLADPSDLASALAFALRYHGRKRLHDADETVAEIVAKRLVEHLERAGFVVMKGRRSAAARRSGGGLTVSSNVVRA